MAISKNKKLTANRGINLNKDICAFAGLKSGDPVEVTAEDNGTVTIRKHSPKCRFCGNIVNAKRVVGIDVCPSCEEKLAKEV
ncbi:MAG: hypothetical protein K2N36_07750, partial [Ruminiclostridium sp.]|nr:hypothetical protein [Ruminiclostridium sp.]